MGQPDVQWTFLRAPNLPQPCFGNAPVSAWGAYRDKKCTRVGSSDHANPAIVADHVLAEAHRVLDKLVSHDVSARHIAVGGFSMGATAAAQIALTYPGAPIGGLVMLNGWLPPAAKAALLESASAREASAATARTGSATGGAPTGAGAWGGLRVLVSHGVRDEQVAFELGEEAARCLRTAGVDVRFEIDQMRHVNSGFGPGRAHAETFFAELFARARGETPEPALDSAPPSHAGPATGPTHVLDSLADPETAMRFT